MGLLEFDKLPINTLVGADVDTFKKICAGRTVEKPYLKKYRLTKAICHILSTMAPIQEKKYQKLLADKPLENPPLFILGHWRSGTTFVHNVLCKDDHFGYNTTYQTVFPHLMMWGQPFFKKTVKWLMPDKRPHDNMELDPGLPQEEEFALGSMMPYSYYNFWFFPEYLDEYCEKYLLFNDITEEEKEIFRETLIKVVKISLWNTGGTQFLSKNPPHTARIKFLMETFPDAKFIYLMRNPYTVFESTRGFFMNAFQPLKLQDVSVEYVEEKILDVYTKLYRRYEEEKLLIPKGNLIEVKFEDFEKDSIGLTERIYNELSLPGYDLAQANINKYLDSKKGFKKNKYKYDSRTVELVEKHWDYAIKDWDYSL